VGAYDPTTRLIWSLAASGKGTTLATGSGNSGGWSSADLDRQSAVDLRQVTDITLLVFTGTPNGSPSLAVALDLFDSLGHLIPAVVQTTAITAAGAAAPVSCGLNGPTIGTYLALPQWGRLSWTVTGAGASFPGCEISVYGR
jgi:hypothetical protein